MPLGGDQIQVRTECVANIGVWVCECHKAGDQAECVPI